MINKTYHEKCLEFEQACAQGLSEVRSYRSRSAQILGENNINNSITRLHAIKATFESNITRV